METEMVEFRGMDWNEEYMENPAFVSSPSRRARLVSVLIYYGKELEYREGKIFIPRSLSEDRDYIVNMCRKANNPEWYQEHLATDIYDPGGR